MADEDFSQEDLDNIDDNDIKEDTTDDKTEETSEETNGSDEKESDKTPDKVVHFSDEFKDDKAKKQAVRYNTIEDMAKGVLGLRQKISEGGVGKPGKDADEVEIAEYRKANGAPETSEGYKFPDFPEGEDTEENQAARKEWQEVFHKHHMSEEAVQDILAKYGEDVVAAQEILTAGDKQFTEDSEAQLRKDWGANYDANKSFAEVAAKEVLGEDFEDFKMVQTLDQKFILDHPVLLRGLSNIGREMSEGGLGAPISDSNRESLEDKADGYREKAKAAQAKGNTAEANKWSEKERDVLEKLDGKEGIVGQGGRNV